MDDKSYFNSNYDNLLKSLNANFIAPMFIIREFINHMKKISESLIVQVLEQNLEAAKHSTIQYQNIVQNLFLKN